MEDLVRELEEKVERLKRDSLEDIRRMQEAHAAEI